MGLMFNILAILNNVGCVLTLTVFILYHRDAFKKNRWEQLGKERGRFREHSIVLLWWVFGTLLISIFNLNILFIFPLLILGAFSATFWSVSPHAQDRDHRSSAHLQQELDFSGGLPESGQQEVSPRQAALLPDLGNHLALKGAPQGMTTVYPSFTIKDIAVVGLGSYCITKAQELDGELYFGAFDFGNEELESILAQATESTRDAVNGSLKQDPLGVRHIPISDPIHVGIKAALGKPQQGIDETFIPLLITEVFPAR